MDFLTTQTGYEFVYRKGVLNTGDLTRYQLLIMTLFFQLLEKNLEQYSEYF